MIGLVPGGQIEHLGWMPFDMDGNPSFNVYPIRWSCMKDGIQFNIEWYLSTAQVEQAGMTPDDLEEGLIKFVNAKYFSGTLFEILGPG